MCATKRIKSITSASAPDIGCGGLGPTAIGGAEKSGGRDLARRSRGAAAVCDKLTCTPYVYVHVYVYVYGYIFAKVLRTMEC